MKEQKEQKPSEEYVQSKLVVEDVELNEDQLEAVAGGAKGGIIGGGCFPINFPGDPTPTFPDTNPILY